MAFKSFKDATPQDKEQLLGIEFRYIQVIEADLSGNTPVVRVLLEGEAITLVGDPSQALATYLGGSGSGRSRH